MESILAARIVDLTWRLRRAKRFRTAAINTMNKKNADSLTNLTQSMIRRALGQSSLPDDPNVSKEDLELGRLIIKDFSNERVIDRLSVHESRIERSLHKTHLEFQRLQFIRQMKPFDLSEEGQEIEPNRLLCKTNPILKQPKINANFCCSKDLPRKTSFAPKKTNPNEPKANPIRTQKRTQSGFIPCIGLLFWAWMAILLAGGALSRPEGMPDDCKCLLEQCLVLRL